MCSRSSAVVKVFGQSGCKTRKTKINHPSHSCSIAAHCITSKHDASVSLLAEMLLIPPCLSPPRPPRIAMASTSSTQRPSNDRTYDDALKALGGLISGKKRPDGSSWAHAFDSMQLHLDVRIGMVAYHPSSTHHAAVAADRPPAPPQRRARRRDQGQGAPVLMHTSDAPWYRAPHAHLWRACCAIAATPPACTPHHTCAMCGSASASTGVLLTGSMMCHLHAAA